MHELQTIKEKAFELLMNLHPKHIKIINNEILRPLYRLAESNDKASVLVTSHEQQALMKQENTQLAARLEQTENESLTIIKSYQNQVNLMEIQAEMLQKELATAQSLLQSKQLIIDQFMMRDSKVKH